MTSTLGPRVQVNPDLAREREKATFNGEKLAQLLRGGADNLRRKRYVESLAQNDPLLKRLPNTVHLSREQQYELSMWRNIHIKQRIEELNLTDPLEIHYYRTTANPNDNSPISLNEGMFIPTIQKQGTEEQLEKWLPLAKSYKIIGTYGQTELGHGTFIRGIETTATYDPKTREFIMNSPTLSSIKYWPGNLGKSVTHSLVLAQLYTKNKCHGIHMFLVPLRSLDNHMPFPGIEVGDIGPKFGFNCNDNGYLRMTNYRIPRENMLMRYSKVFEDGTFVKPENTKLLYGSMVFIRALIVSDSATNLGKACTIAIRYSAVRRQTEVRPGGEELQILDYQTQQSRLLPLLASAYAFHLTTLAMIKTYLRVDSDIEEGKLGEMNQLHALASGLKGFTSWVAASGIEQCRLCCGGHGYSMASGLPKIYTNFVPSCTYEGENMILMLQTARYLLKCYAKIRQGEELPSVVSYLGQNLTIKSSITEQFDLASILMAYQHRAARLLKVAGDKISRLVRSGCAQEDAWNKTSVQSAEAAMAYCHAYTVEIFVEWTQDHVTDPAIQKVISSLCRLYGVYGICQNLGDFMQDGYLSSHQADLLKAKYLDLLAEIRTNAVALVDSLDFSDTVLESALGRFDGNVYEALYEYAKNSPLNKTEVHETYHKYLKPFMRAVALVVAMMYDVTVPSAPPFSREQSAHIQNSVPEYSEAVLSFQNEDTPKMSHP
ncbi:hypothetical protein ScPMuIL_007508 [Solemya velum]